MATDITRRDLIRSAALAGGIAALGGVFSEVPARASQSKNEKLNLGCIGCGGQGGGDIAQLDDENIVALCDVDEARAADTFAKYPKAKRFKDFRKMIDEMGKSIDAVTVSIPDHMHAPASAYAMHHGKHVYCQKPLTHSPAEARALMELARKHKLVTQMGTQGHAFPANIRAVELIESGAIGAVTEVHVVTDRPSGWWPQGVEKPATVDPVPSTLDWELWLGVAAERPYNKAYLPFVWRGWWDFGTGALGDMACHLMDVPFWSLKLGHAKAVEAQGEPLLPDSGPKWSIIKYEFDKRTVNPMTPSNAGNSGAPQGSGAGGQVELPAVTITWYDGGKKPSLDITDGRELAKDFNGSIFIGSKGKLLLEHSRKAELLPAAQFEGFKGPDQYLPRPVNHYRQWVEACKTNGPTGSNFDFAGPMTESILLGNVSLRTGKRIEYDAKAMKAKGVPEADPYIHYHYRGSYKL